MFDNQTFSGTFQLESVSDAKKLIESMLRNPEVIQIETKSREEKPDKILFNGKPYFPRADDLKDAGMLTADGMRELFAEHLTYSQVTLNDIRALEGFLAIEYAQHERNGEHMDMRPSYRKRYQPAINFAEDGIGIKSAFLRVSGFYFSGREAISFNEDGFIGFAGWADSVNIQPFLKAFRKWVMEWMLVVTR